MARPIRSDLRRKAQLRSGGTLTLAVTAPNGNGGILGWTREDRDFIFSLFDLVDAYVKCEPAPGKEPPREEESNAR